MKKTHATKGLFVIGTDTGVGKTTIAGALARSLLTRGINCGVMKPIETGCERKGKELIPADGVYLKSAARSTESLNLIAPCRYQAPLSPYAAVLQGERSMDGASILSAFQKLESRHDFMILEGLGGLLVPLNEREELMDLVKEIDLPVLLVARSGLGTLNHSLLSIRYGRAHGVRFSGLLLNCTRSDQAASEKTNLKILSERAEAPVMGPFPVLSPRSERESFIEESRVRLEQDHDMNDFLDTLETRKSLQQ